MSVLSSLALLVASAAKVLNVKGKPLHANIDALQTKLDDLNAENARLIDRIRESSKGTRGRGSGGGVVARSGRAARAACPHRAFAIA